MPLQHRRRWADFKRRLTASQQDLYAESVRAEGAGYRACDSLEPGAVATVTGRVTTVTFTPAVSMPVLSADLFDGTATVTLVWLGRRRIVGIEPGRRLIASGRVAIRDEDRRVIYNPWYEIADTQG